MRAEETRNLDLPFGESSRFSPGRMSIQAIPELSIEYFLLNLAVAVVVVGYFTYRNAESRGESGLLWGGVVAAASFFLSLVGFLVVFLVYYLVVVRD